MGTIIPLKRLAPTSDSSNGELVDRVRRLTIEHEQLSQELDEARAELVEVARAQLPAGSKSITLRGSAGSVRVTQADRFRSIDSTAADAVKVGLGKVFDKLFTRTETIKLKKTTRAQDIRDLCARAGVEVASLFDVGELFSPVKAFRALLSTLSMGTRQKDIANQLAADLQYRPRITII